MTSSPTRFLSPSEIADLAGVSRAAVSNWRRRHDDFPPPAGGTDTKPLYDAEAVRTWLTGHGHQVKTPEHAAKLHGHLNIWRGSLPVVDLVTAALALLPIRQSAPTRWQHVTSGDLTDVAACLDELGVIEAHMLAELLTRMNETQPLAPLVTEIAGIPDSEQATTADTLLQRLTASRAYASEFASRASTTLIEAASSHLPADAVVYDPTCGFGGTLLAIASQVPGTHTRAYGQDINRSALAIAQMRALLHGIDADFTLGDVLTDDPHPQLLVDTVACEPPWALRWDSTHAASDPRWQFGVPPRMSADLAWVQIAIAHLKPEGRGYVLTTNAATSAGGVSRDIRSQPIRRGCLETIIAMPARMMTNTGIAFTLWVVRPPQPEATPVMFIDATGEREPENHIRSWLTGAQELPPHRQVPALEILAADATLTPQHWVSAPATMNLEESVSDLTTARDDLRTTQTRIAGLDLPSLDVPNAGMRVATVKELADSGMVTIHRLNRRETAGIDKHDPRLLRPSDLKNQILPPVETNTPPSGDVTEPGTVLVCVTGELHSAYDKHGGHLHQDWTIRLQANPEHIDPVYLAYCLGQPWNHRFFEGATIKRANINALEVPLPPLDVQHAIAEDLTRAHELKQAATQLAASANAAQRAFLNTLMAHTNAASKARV